MREHELSELEIEQEGLRVKVKKDSSGGFVVHAPGAAAQPTARAAATAPPVPAVAAAPAPIVGTFYRSPEPGAPPFVDIGTTVKKGQVLCIIEAMKLMNEIECEYDGEIMNVYVEGGQPVQYGERLFAIRTR